MIIKRDRERERNYFERNYVIISISILFTFNFFLFSFKLYDKYILSQQKHLILFSLMVLSLSLSVFLIKNKFF